MCDNCKDIIKDIYKTWTEHKKDNDPSFEEKAFTDLVHWSKEDEEFGRYVDNYLRTHPETIENKMVLLRQIIAEGITQHDNKYPCHIKHNSEVN